MRKAFISSVALLVSPTLFAAINNEAFTFIGFNAGQITYKEGGTLSSGVKFETSPTTTNIFNYSGGYTPIGDRFGFYINNTSTLTSDQANEEWSASGTNGSASVDGVYQTDLASSKHQALDMLGGYLLGGGHQVVFGASYTQSSIDRSGFKSGSALDAFNQTNLAPYVGTEGVLGNGTPENTYEALENIYGADPNGKIRNFTETFTTFALQAGYKYDSLFKSRELGSRVQFGATIGLPMYYSVVNTSSPTLTFDSSFEGFDVGLNAGYGWRFTENVGLIATVNYFYRIRPELKQLLQTRAQAIESSKNVEYTDSSDNTVKTYADGVDLGRDRYASIPENELSYWNVGLSAYWNF
ncbi:hypothetical protein GV054_04865 [Marinomonas mediterranea]|uniref:outer membrane beta-barrel protein n=1 Tax=Marinomonas mediterranea TaxID=119864 RepID=UPI00234B1C6B|nr:hypothetical protein [Marinomonas mediterranea]WCN12380.1 hypothetical protein GV054_04865 [Marinomonas mediterranea]